MYENPKTQSSVAPQISHSLFTLTLSVTGPTFADQAAEDLFQRSDFILCQRLGCCRREVGLIGAWLHLLVAAVLAAGGLCSHVSVDARRAFNLHVSLTAACLEDKSVKLFSESVHENCTVYHH